MYPLPGRCPVCSETLDVTRLHCPQCDTTIEGRFFPGRLSRLNEEQVHFVETFVRCEGTIKRVEKELGISYPTVRARLREVIHALGFEVVSDYADAPGAASEAERRAILDRLYSGELTTEEAIALLKRA